MESTGNLGKDTKNTHTTLHVSIIFWINDSYLLLVSVRVKKNFQKNTA